MELQRPDFQILKWSASDEAHYSKSARTLANPIEDGRGLYTELQKIYQRKNVKDQPASSLKTLGPDDTTFDEFEEAARPATVRKSTSTTGLISPARSPVKIDQEYTDSYEYTDGYDYAGTSEYHMMEVL